MFDLATEIGHPGYKHCRAEADGEAAPDAAAA